MVELLLWKGADISQADKAPSVVSFQCRKLLIHAVLSIFHQCHQDNPGSSTVFSFFGPKKSVQSEKGPQIMNEDIRNLLDRTREVLCYYFVE